MKKLLSILLVLAMVISLGLTAFAEGEKDDPDLKTFLSELAEKDKVTEEDLSELLTILGNRIAEEIGTGLSDADAKQEITSKDMTFYLYGVDDTRMQPVYFVGDSDVPYLSLEDWGELMTYLMKEYINKDQNITFGLSFSKDGETGTLTRTDGDPYTMTVDCAADTITFVDYDAFVLPEADRVLLDVLDSDSPHSEEETGLFSRVSGSSYERYGDEVVLDLGAYGIDLVADENAVYVPAQTLTDFLLALKYVNLFYNGEALYFLEFGGLDEDAVADLYYDVEKKEISEATGKFSYAELCLVFDNLYGLKDAHGITSFEDLVDQTNARDALMGTDTNTADSALYYIISRHLDDRHSGFTAPSPFSRDDLKDDLDKNIGYGRTILAAITQKLAYLRARAEVYPEGVPGYEEIGNTAYITFDEFVAEPDGVDYQKTAPTADAVDTIGVLSYAYSQIMRENSPVENVVMDLSCNGGGDSDAAVYAISAFLGDGYASVTNTMSGALATGVYNIDLNLDGKFDEKDRGLTEKKLFCLISPNSFSCGNLVPNIFKNSNQVTLIGRNSAGGSCMILPLSTATGAVFQISGPTRLAFTKNGSFYDIDQGVDPDYYVDHIENLYNRTAMTEFINGLF